MVELARVNPQLLAYINGYRAFNYADFINAAHHEWMGSNIEIVEQLLRRTFPGQPEEFYIYGRWAGGAYNSDRFDNLPEAEKNAIEEYLRRNNLYD